MKETCSCTCSYKLHTSKPLSSTIQNDEKCRPPPPTTGFLAALQRFCIPTVMGSKLSSLPDQTKTLQNLTISPKSHNFSKISQFLQNLTITAKFHNFAQFPQFQQHFTISPAITTKFPGILGISGIPGLHGIHGLLGILGIRAVSQFLQCLNS